MTTFGKNPRSNETNKTPAFNSNTFYPCDGSMQKEQHNHSLPDSNV